MTTRFRTLLEEYIKEEFGEVEAPRVINSIKPTSKLIDDLGFDSLDLWLFNSKLENIYPLENLNLLEYQIVKVKTLDEICQICEYKTN